MLCDIHHFMNFVVLLCYDRGKEKKFYVEKYFEFTQFEPLGQTFAL